MSEARRRWWMRTVAAVIGGGGAAAGAWVGFARPAKADQDAPVLVAVEPQAAPRPVPPEPFERPRDTSVIPAAAPPAPADLLPPADLPLPPAPVLPAIPPSPTAPALPAVPEVKPVSPVVPVGAPAPFPPASVPPLPAPALPEVPAVPKASAPAIPAVEPVKVPAVDAAKVPPPAPPAFPAPEAVKPVTPKPSTPSAEPIVPVLPAPGGLTPPPLPVPSTPSVPDLGAALPAPTQLAPTAPAQKVTEPVLPAPTAKPESNLPASSGGGNVKTDKVGGGSAPVSPIVPVLPTPEPVKTPAASPASEPTGLKLPAAPTTDKPRDTQGTTVSRPSVPEVPLRSAEKPPVALPAPTTTNTLVTPPGDSTMIPLSRSAAAAVIGGMLLTPPTAPVRAASPVSAPVIPAPTAPVVPVQADDTADLKKQLKESNDKLTTIQDRLTRLTELLDGKRDDKGFTLPSDPGLVAQMRDLKDRLAAVEKRLEEYKSLKPTTVTPTNPIVDAKAGKGTVRVVNEYPVQISIVINGTSHRIAPSRTLDVDVNAGDFTYQLLESGAAMTKSVLKEKETVTLRIK